MTDSSTPLTNADPEGSRTDSEEGPVTTGTLFIMVLFLMALAGLWSLMYLMFLDR